MSLHQFNDFIVRAKLWLFDLYLPESSLNLFIMLFKDLHYILFRPSQNFTIYSSLEFLFSSCSCSSTNLLHPNFTKFGVSDLKKLRTDVGFCFFVERYLIIPDSKLSKFFFFTMIGSLIALLNWSRVDLHLDKSLKLLLRVALHQL